MDSGPGGCSWPQLGQYADQAGAWLGDADLPPRGPGLNVHVDRGTDQGLRREGWHDGVAHLLQGGWTEHDGQMRHGLQGRQIDSRRYSSDDLVGHLCHLAMGENTREWCASIIDGHLSCSMLLLTPLLSQLIAC